MSMGGGGQPTGGAVVGGPSAQAAAIGGILQAKAAATAAQAAKDQTQMAINTIRQQYGDALQTLKPYTSTGITALSELNKYMGLAPYNPGTAPRTPEAPTLENLKKNITDYQISDYITQHLNYYPQIQNGRASGANRISYSGLAQMKPGTDQYGRSQWTSNPTTFADPVGFLMDTGVTGTAFTEGARQAIAQQNLPGAQEAYKANMDVYNQQMDLYNQAKGLYEQDVASGPLSSQEVIDKLMNQPGVQFQYNQGLDAIQRAASSKGMLGSGRLLQSLVDYGQGTAQQQYGATLSRLAGLVQMGQQTSSQSAQNAMGVGQMAGGMQANLADTIANSYLAQGNALAQGYLAGNQQYKVVGQQESGGGGLGGIGSILGGIGSIASSGLFGSSKTLKDKVSTPSTEELLEKVRNLEIDKWKYKGTDAEHIGPYAEDFAESFGVGDGKTISIIDYLGVLLGAVKELSMKVEELSKGGK